MKKKILLIVFSLILFTTGLTGQNSFQTQQQY
jgi:hypothetical protein